MAQALQVRHQTIASEEVLSRLVDYQMLSQFLREVIIDQAIAAFPCSPADQVCGYQAFFKKHNLVSESEQRDWLEQNDISPKQLDILATRPIRIEMFKQATWGTKLKSYFLRRKSDLDRVVYSLIRVSDADIALELYFRLQNGEQTFTELAKTYSQGSRAKLGGLVGPIELGKIDRFLAQLLSTSQPGQLFPPLNLSDGVAIVRLEQLMPAQFNAAMQQYLLDELFETWLQNELLQLAKTGLISFEPV